MHGEQPLPPRASRDVDPGVRSPRSRGARRVLARPLVDSLTIPLGLPLINGDATTVAIKARRAQFCRLLATGLTPPPLLVALEP